MGRRRFNQNGSHSGCGGAPCPLINKRVFQLLVGSTLDRRSPMYGFCWPWALRILYLTFASNFNEWTNGRNLLSNRWLEPIHRMGWQCLKVSFTWINPSNGLTKYMGWPCTLSTHLSTTALYFMLVNKTFLIGGKLQFPFWDVYCIQQLILR